MLEYLGVLAHWWHKTAETAMQEDVPDIPMYFIT